MKHIFTNELSLNRRRFLKTSAFAAESRKFTRVDSGIIRLRCGVRLNILFA